MKDEYTTFSIAILKTVAAEIAQLGMERKDFLFEAFTAYKKEDYSNKCYKLFREMIA